jgi:hypothetical protein
MNNGFSGTNTYDEGLIFNRGTSQNQAIIWSEVFGEFRLIATNETGTTYGNITAAGLARLSIGSLNVPGQANIGVLVTSGAITGSSLNVSGNVLASTSIAQLHTGSTATFGNVAAVTVGNVGTQFNGAAINLSGNILSTGAVHNALTVNGNETISGYINAAGNISTPQLNAGQINTTGNVLATAGTFNALTVNGNESVTGFLNVTGNVLTAQLNAGQINTTGNVLATEGVFNGLTVNGYTNVNGNLSTAQLNAGQINTTGNVLATAAVFNGLTVNGNETISGYINAAGNISTPQLNAGQINTTGNILATEGVFNGLTVNGNETVTGFLNVTSNVLATAGTFNALTVNGNETVTGFLNVTGNILGAAGTLSELTVNGNASVTGFLNVGGNIIATTVDTGGIEATGVIFANSTLISTSTTTGALQVAGGVGVAGNLNIGTVGAASGQFHTVMGNISQTSSGGAVYFNTAGNVMAAVGQFGAINSTGYINTSGNISTAQLNAGQINTTGNVLATAGTFNSLTVNGNESVTGYLNVTGNVMAAVVTASQINTTGNVLATAGTFNALTVNGNETVTGFLNVTGNVIATTAEVGSVEASGVIYANSSAATTTQGTGALILPNGGISVAGAANIAGTTTIGGATQLNNTLSVGGLSYYTNTTNATEATGASGALQIKGGASIAKDLHIGGNIYASNIFGTSYQIITVQDPLLYLDAANTFPYNYDIGFYSNFVGPNPLDNTGNAYQHSGVVRDNADNTWKFFSNVRSEPSGASVTFNADTIYDPVRAGNLTLTYTQAATSTTTGALIVAGGAGIAGTVVAGQINSTGNVLGQAATFNALTVNGNETVTGFLNVTGNILTASVSAGQLNTTGNLVASTVLAQLVTADDATFGNVAAGFVGNTGTVYTGASINLTGNVLAAAGIFNATTVNGNESVTGFLNVTGNIMTAQLNAGQVNTTGNVLAQAGVFDAVTVNGNGSVTGNLNVGSNILALNILSNFITADDAVIGNISASLFGNVGAVFTGTTAAFNGNVIGGLAQFAAINSTPIGNATASTGAFTTLRASEGIWANSTTATTNTTTGAIVVAGGIGVAGNIWQGGAYLDTSSSNYIFASTPTAVTAFTAASTLSIGDATGTMTLRNPSILGVSATQTLFNTTATTINFAGATTDLTIGATSGTANIRQANIWLPNATSLDGAQTGINLFTQSATNANVLIRANVIIGANVGTTTIQNPTLVGTQTTQNVYNTIATTVNAFGAATTLTVGATNSGNLIVRNDSLFIQNNANVNGTRDATTTTSAALTVAGGAAVKAGMIVGGALFANATVDTNGYGNGAINVPNGGITTVGNIISRDHIFAGPIAYEVTAGFESIIFAGADANEFYVQSALLNTDNRGSTDFAAYAADGNDGGAWADMGFTGNAFADPNYTITKQNDGYFFVKPGNGWGGNLVLATSENGTYNDIIIGVGSFDSSAEVMRFHGNIGTTGNAWLKYTTVATTPNTGALRVDGGVGIGGNIRAGGGAVINNSQTADPFQVKGVATTSLIYADTAQGAVVIGGSNVAPQLGSTLKINGVDSMLLPIGSTGQRPGATGNIDLAGMLRFNTTIQNMEFYDGTQWQTAGSVFTIISDRQFAGNAGSYGNVDGTNTTFTIQANSTTSATLVSINGVMQFPVLAYEVTNSTLTFTEPPAPTDVIDVRVLATTSTIGALANGNGLNQVIAGNDGVQIWTGTSATTQRILVNQVGDVNLLDNNKITYTQNAVNIVANNTPYVIATYSQTAYTTAKFLVSAKKGATNFQSMESIVTTDGAGNAYMTTYAVVSNGIDMGGLTANVVGGNVRVYFTTTTNVINANIKAMGTYIV